MDEVIIELIHVPSRRLVNPPSPFQLPPFCFQFGILSALGLCWASGTVLRISRLSGQGGQGSFHNSQNGSGSKAPDLASYSFDRFLIFLLLRVLSAPTFPKSRLRMSKIPHGEANRECRNRSGIERGFVPPRLAFLNSRLVLAGPLAQIYRV